MEDRTSLNLTPLALEQLVSQTEKCIMLLEAHSLLTNLVFLYSITIQLMRISNYLVDAINCQCLIVGIIHKIHIPPGLGDQMFKLFKIIRTYTISAAPQLIVSEIMDLQK